MANGFAQDDGSALITNMTPDGAVDAAARWVTDEIHAITMDHGITGFYAPVVNLAAIRAHVRAG